MKILVRGTNWIGDAVMSVPALKQLRRIFPDAHIALHTRTWADGLFGDAPFIDELVTFDKGRWAVKDVYDNSQFLKGDGYDMAIVLPNSFESALTSFMSSIPVRFGYNRDLRGLLLTDPIAVPEWKNRRHEVYYYLNLISEVEKRTNGRDTVSVQEPDTSLEITAAQMERARTILSGAGVDTARKLVVLAVGSTNSLAKRWPAKNYADVSRSLINDLGANVVLAGSPDEAKVAAGVAAAAGNGVVDLVGKTQLGEAVGILGAADLMISNDMGLAHVAAAVGTPTIVLFGPTNPATTRPWGANVHVVQRDVSCEACDRNDESDRHVCARWGSVEEVVTAAKEILADADIADTAAVSLELR